MSASKDRVLAQLKQVSGAICDDCLPNLATLGTRQAARRLCQELERLGETRRTLGQCAFCGKTKTVTTAQMDNNAQQSGDAALRGESDPTNEIIDPNKPWYWEGNVQSTLVTWLKSHGFFIDHVANTATREAGKDIIAVAPDGKTLWVSVKGFPQGERHTTTQARHWFSHAVFDIVLYRNERSDVNLALAFPEGFRTYKALAARIGVLRRAIPFTIYWISESGTVRIDQTENA